MNFKRGIWDILHGKKSKPADDGPTWIVGGILLLIGVILLLIFGD